MQPLPLSAQQYVRRVLSAYRTTPGTAGKVRAQDRLVASELYRRSLPLLVVENALLLAAARRLFRCPHDPPLATIRSLAYFLPVIDEVLKLEVSQDYFRYLRHKLQRHVATPPDC